MKKTIYFSTRVTDKVEEIYSAEVCDYVEWPEGLDKIAATIIGTCDDDPLVWIYNQKSEILTVCFDSAGETVIIFRGTEEEVLEELAKLQTKVQKEYERKKAAE